MTSVVRWQSDRSGSRVLLHAYPVPPVLRHASADLFAPGIPLQQNHNIRMSVRLIIFTLKFSLRLKGRNQDFEIHADYMFISPFRRRVKTKQRWPVNNANHKMFCGLMICTQRETNACTGPLDILYRPLKYRARSAWALSCIDTPNASGLGRD